MSSTKKLSNPFSTGGGGFQFEAHVQASFVTLMLTGGHAPCLPCWPITKIKLQGKVDGFDTDDLVVYVENPSKREKRKLLVQVKHSIAITERSKEFRKVMQAAWNDFNSPKVFTKGKDVIALITGPVNKTDSHTVLWLLNQARHTNDVGEFFRNVQETNFSPNKSTMKLIAFQEQLKAANGGIEVKRDELYEFLKHFHLLGYDLGNESGVILSLLHSHISQRQQQYPMWAWSRLVDIVQSWNKDAGTITSENLPEDIQEAFKQKAVEKIPEELKATKEKTVVDWAQHSDASYLALAVLIGAWNENNLCDVDAATQLLGISYNKWLNKAGKILHNNSSPISIDNGIWRVVNRAELWRQIGSRILDQNLEIFKELSISILKEPDPSIKLAIEKGRSVRFREKGIECSHTLRNGIAGGLAILGTMPDVCGNCSQGRAEITSLLAVREILSEADDVLWGTLNNLLPNLAEAAPSEFLDAVERALRQTTCPFDKLFSLEGDGIIGGNYLAGLLWALESLAWEEQYLVRVCVVLGELASHDPGGPWANRPSNSLVSIFLPWLPQTLASIDKRKVAVQTLLKEWPVIAWKLIIQLLPGKHQRSSGSHKPSWRKTIPDDWEKGVTEKEYWQQVSFYAELAVSAAGHNIDRLSVLIDNFDSLPQPAFDQLIKVVSSQPISALSEDNRRLLWDHLTRLINHHVRYSDTQWALQENQITKLKQVADKLAPTNPLNLYQHLFTDHDYEFFDEESDWEEQTRNLDKLREKAISKIIARNGIEGITRFAESVTSPRLVGYALGVVFDELVERAILPDFLNASENERKAVASGFIWRRYHISDWEWCDDIDKSYWTPAQIGQFLAYLPFTKKAWDRVPQWLQNTEGEYWTRTGANAYHAGSDLAIAIEKLIEYSRPHAAINCLNRMRHAKLTIDIDQCVRALLTALDSSEPTHIMNRHYIVKLVKLLQEDPLVKQDDLLNVEWAYLPLLASDKESKPLLLERKLAEEPEFFCKVIQLIYRSKNETQPTKEPTKESKEIATNAWHLLHAWKKPPGSQNDEAFSENRFTEWLQSVKLLCSKSGHLEVALINIGRVLIHVPADPSGLWIHRAVAAVIDDRDSDKLREGYRAGVFNSRGVHWVDPTGKPEKELADQFTNKAEEIENAGFQRFAVILRSLAERYEREAEHIIAEHKLEDE